MTPDERLAKLEELAALRKQASEEKTPVRSFAKKLGNSLLAGFGGAAANAPDALSLLPLPDQGAGMKELADNTRETYREIGKKGFQNSYAKAAVEGIGSMGAAPIGLSTQPVKSVLGMVGAGAGGGLGAEAGSQFLPESSAASFLGGLAGGGLGGFALGPKQSIGQADIRRALGKPNEQTFAEASRNLKDFEGAGATTATLAEAFPIDSPLVGLANQARNGPVGNALALQTQGREKDLQRLGETALARIGPQVEPGEVANRAAAAAENRVGRFEGLRSKDYGNAIERAPPIPPQSVKELRNYLENQAKGQAVGERAAAYRAMANALKRADNSNSLTNLRDIVDKLKMAKDIPLSRNAGTASKAETTIYNEAYAFTVDQIKFLSPAFAKAEATFKNASEGVINPLESGPIGQLAGRNFKGNAPVGAGRLGSIGNLQQPSTIKNTMGGLAEDAPSDPNLLRDIATAIAQKRLAAGKSTPGTDLRGAEGSIQDNAFNSILEAAGKSPEAIASIGQPLRAADRLQNNLKAPVSQTSPTMRGLQLLLRPFRTLDMITTGRTENSIQNEIATILADRTPTGLEKIRILSQFDPTFRAAMSANGGILPFLARPEER